MDKREKIKQAIERVWQDFNTPDTFVDAIFAILDEPAEPKRDWLKVDGGTPKETLCRMRGCDYYKHWQIDVLLSFDHNEDAPYEGNRGMADEAERFIGIHLLDNPGLDAQPCDGLVLMAFTSLEVEMGNAQDYDWDFRCAPPHILQWAPVKWVEGRLVVDLDRLRG